MPILREAAIPVRRAGHIYDRQIPLEDMMHPIVQATVVGCGGTGWWTALFLAMTGTNELVLIDGDTVDESNLNRLPIHMRDVGRMKVDVLYQFIKNLRPDCNVRRYAEWLDFKDPKVVDVLDKVLVGRVFCCTDTLTSQMYLNRYCEQWSRPYTRVGYDGLELNVSRSMPLTFKEPKDEVIGEGYQHTPSWVVPSVVAAALGVYRECIGWEHRLELLGHMDRLCIQDADMISVGLKAAFTNELINHQGYGYCNDCDERRDCDNCNVCDGCEKQYPDDTLEDVRNGHIDGYGYCGNCRHCDDCERVDYGQVLDDIQRGYEKGYGRCDACSQIDELKAELGDMKGTIADLEAELEEAKGGCDDTG